MVYIIHGLFHTGDRWKHLAERIGECVSVYSPDLPKVREIAKAIAPRIIGADTIIAHSMGGLVLYDMISLHMIPRPKNIIFVAVPFNGIPKLRLLKPAFGVVKLPKNDLIIKFMASYTVKNKEFIDDIMIRDAYATTTDASYQLLKEITDYKVVLQPIHGSNVYLCEGQYDQLVERVDFPGATRVMFNNSGHTLMLEDEDTFVSFVNEVRRGDVSGTASGHSGGYAHALNQV